MLFTQQEINATVALLNRTPMSPAEMLFAQGFFQRLAQFCQPPKPAEEGSDEKFATYPHEVDPKAV